MTSTGIITNIQRCSTEDGPGIRTTVFLKGCPMSCIWCHNIETIDPKPTVVWYTVKCIGDQACVRACPEGALEMTPDGLKINREQCVVCGTCEDACPTGAVKVMGKEWSSEDLVQELLRDKVFFETSNGGVTISGGEATFQAKFTMELAKGLQAEGVHVALDTCGYCSEKTLNDLLPHVDMVLYDLKTMDPNKHEQYTGVPLDTVLSNARIIAESKKSVWIRTPVIPEHTDDEDNIRRIARFILKNMPTVERYDLLAFNRMCIDKYALFDLEFPLKDLDLMIEETMEHLAQIARDEGLSNVVWSGMTKNTKNEEVIDSQEVKTCG
ncbi:MAG: glycyl-radical enzyme activating protein [Candidatus Thorarchaeota archaeon]|nr:glycyl-radical enzyme activating protein [Candidatus Thorarchaeota archaeon]